MALSEAAKKYDRDVKRVVGDMAGFLSLQTGPEVVYQFDLTLYFGKLENPGWFERWDKTVYYTRNSKDGKHKRGEVKHHAGERKAKTRYKRIDYDNRIKFLQDRVAEAFGIDDCQIFRGVSEKRESLDNPRAVVRVRVRERDQFFEGRPDAQV